MNELKTTKKTEIQKAEKTLQINLSKAIKKLTVKITSENEVLSKKIEKWSKKLAKKISKEIKAHSPVIKENEPAAKAVEITVTDTKEKPVAKKAPVRKKKIVAEEVK